MNSLDIISGVQKALHYHHSLGITDYPACAELEEFLAITPPVEQPRKARVVAPAPRQTCSRQQVAGQSPSTSSKVSQRSTTQQVAESRPVSVEKSKIETVNCQDLCPQCSLKAQSLAHVEGRGGKSVRLLVVGGWRVHSREILDSSVFGVEEDLMLARMFAAMKLSKEQVYVTNLVRCSLPPGVRPDKESVQLCLRLFHEQVRRLQPELICTMGTLASRTIIGKQQALSQLRGAFYQKELLPDRTVPVFATYHPTFLLANSEMKRPTWDDLQRAIGRLAKKRV